MKIQRYFYPTPLGLPRILSVEKRSINKVEKPKISCSPQERVERQKMSFYDLQKSIRNGKRDFRNSDFSALCSEPMGFNGLNFENSSFLESDLKEVIFENCNLKGVDFRRANLTVAKFINCQTDQFTDLRGARIDESRGLISSYDKTIFSLPPLFRARAKYPDSKSEKAKISGKNEELFTNFPKQDNFQFSYYFVPLKISPNEMAEIPPADFSKYFSVEEISPAIKNHILHCMFHFESSTALENGLTDLLMILGSLKKYENHTCKEAKAAKALGDYCLHAFVGRLNYIQKFKYKLKDDLRPMLASLIILKELGITSDRLERVKTKTEEKVMKAYHEKNTADYDGFSEEELKSIAEEKLYKVIEDKLKEIIRNRDLGYSPADNALLIEMATPLAGKFKSKIETSWHTKRFFDNW